MAVKVFRCRICGDPYIGEQPPSRCPFCGAEAKYIINAYDWDSGEFDVELSEVSRKNLEAALDLEMGNVAFYACAEGEANAAGDEYMLAKFKSLRKVESEHASARMKEFFGALVEIETDHLEVHAADTK